MTLVIIGFLCLVSIPTVCELSLGIWSWSFAEATGIIESLKATRSDSGIVESARIQYRFSVLGTEVVGFRLAFGRPRDLEHVLNAYYEGQLVKIFYCKQIPSLCVLIPGVRFSTVVGCVISAGFWSIFFLYTSGMLAFLNEYVRSDQTPGS